MALIFFERMREQVERLLRGGNGVSSRKQEQELAGLIDRYEEVASGNPELAARLRREFLQAVGEGREAFMDDRFTRFLAEQVEPGDFAALEWHTPEKVIVACERLVSIPHRGEVLEGRVRAHVQVMLRGALQRFERRGDLEAMFRLLEMAPAFLPRDDPELLRLRSRAYLYEVRRVRRRRRILFLYLAIQLVVVGLVFPYLFINAENGALQNRIEGATALDLPEEGGQQLTYLDGLYWAIITAASIGYGDVTPSTAVGRALAAILGVMGVITVGVIAGLILEWISPRSLD